MALQLVEPAVVALKARLDANLAAAIATVNAAVTDGYTIDAPAQTLDYVPPLDLIAAFPCVVIQLGPGRFEDDTGWSATGRYELTVGCFLQNSDQQALVRQVRRYVLALARVALEGRNLGTGTGVPWGTGLQSVDYGPSLRSKAQSAMPPASWWTWGELTMWVKLDEEG